jgi:tetratricopeptide (TPR) repeat protein
MHYLHYAYMQTARDDDAQKLFASLKDVPAIEPDEVTDEGLAMRALYVMETHQWQMGAQLDDHPPTVAFVRTRLHWAQAIAAAHIDDRKSAQRHVKALRRAFAELRKENRSDPGTSPMVTEAEAWLEFARGNHQQAVKKMQAAVEAEEFGVDHFALPARELLGDLLLELKRPAEALEAYEFSLKATPGRFNSLFGAARSAELAGKPETARRYYGELVKMANPNSERPQLLAARAYMGLPAKP